MHQRWCLARVFDYRLRTLLQFRPGHRPIIRPPARQDALFLSLRGLPEQGHEFRNINVAMHIGIDAQHGANALHDFLSSEEHTSELQSLMRNSYAVFRLKKKKTLWHMHTLHD